MSYGFEAINDFGHVLVSSEFHNLHWIGDARVVGHEQVLSSHGGFRHITYRIPAIDAPIPFITLPNSDYYGVAGVRRVSDGAHAWEIDVVASGTSKVEPRMLCFVDADNVWPPAEQYGFVVKDAQGETAFDSRARPLVVTNAGQVRPRGGIYSRSVSLNAKYCRSSTSSAMRPNRHNTYNWLFEEEEPAFFFPTLGTGFRMEGEEEDDESTNWYGETTVEVWVSVYWVFYRSAIRKRDGNLECGWIAVDHGCAYEYESASGWGFGGWLGAIIGLISGGIGGMLTGIVVEALISGYLHDTSSGGGGSGPDSSYTTNTKNTPIMVTDASLYQR